MPAAASHRIALWIAAAVTVVALLAGIFAARDLVHSGAAALAPPTLLERNTLKALNAQRRAHHLSPFTYSPAMARLARDHTRDMVARNYFSHDEPNGGPTYAERVNKALHVPGIHRLEENIAYGYPSAAALVAGWMSSPEHRANILNPAVHKSGLGIQVASHYQAQAHVVVATNDFSN